MNSDVREIAVEALRARITRIFPEQVRACVAQLDDEQIWWRPNEGSNSIGNLVLHLAGSLNYYLNRAVGGFEYERDRPAEFAERRPLPKAELLAIFDDMVAKAEKTFENIGPDRLSETSPEPKMYSILLEDLIGVATHMSTHAGQIVWITKMLREGGVDEVWMRTHRELGGWKRRGDATR